MANEKKSGIAKSDWASSFSLIGEAKVNDYTYKIDAKSEKSSWIYNSLNLGVDCGEKHGTVYVELMGGYSDERENVIYAHGKDDDGNEDWSKQIIVDWEDRFDESVLEEIGDGSFLTVGLEKTTAGKTYYKKFLSAYDAIAYIQEHLTDGTVVNIRGRLQYSIYNDVTQVRKTIQSIVLSNVDEPSKYRANFTQSILIDKESASLKKIDKDKGVMYVDARVLDYVKELNGVEIKGQYPFAKQFEFEVDLTNPELCKKVVDKVFKVKKGITQITFDGDFIEGGATITATMDDVPDDIKDLIAIGVYTEEEALEKCSASGSRERRMVLRKPHIKLVGDDKIPTLQKFEQKYTEDDLVIDIGGDEEELPFDEDEDSSDDDSDMSWLEDL
nr:MAG TPA: Single strand DNA binding protein [Caudoviricetes sp.]